MYNYKKYFYSSISFYFVHKYMSKRYPDIKRYEEDKLITVHSDCIFGPKNINIKSIYIFYKKYKVNVL